MTKAKNSIVPLAVVTSDCHLEDRTWNGRTTLCGDAYFSFQQIVDYAVDHSLPIIAAGDLLDKQRNQAPLVRFTRCQIERLRRAELPFLYIQGQHEYQTTPWLSAISSWPRHLERHKFALGEFAVRGFDWTPADELDAKLRTLTRDLDILVLHQVTQEWMGNLVPAELRFSQIPYAQTVIIGDYHELSGVESHVGASGQMMNVLSPGSTCLQSISEPPNKYFYVLDSGLSYESVPLKTREVIRPPQLLSEDQLGQFLENVGHQLAASQRRAGQLELPEQLCKPILYVQYRCDIPNIYARVTKAVGDLAHLFIKELRPEQAELRQQQQELRETILHNGLLGALPTFVPDKKTARFKLSQRLLSSDDPRSVLAALRQQKLGS